MKKTVKVNNSLVGEGRDWGLSRYPTQLKPDQPGVTAWCYQDAGGILVIYQATGMPTQILVPLKVIRRYMNRIEAKKLRRALS